MKIVILFALFALCASSSIFRRNLTGGDIESIAKQNGYATVKYEVQTEDGYILEFFRLYHGYKGDASPSDNEESSESSRVQKDAVLLLHGYLYSAEEFLLGGRSQALAFYLVEQGYDVYLGNARGSVYGQRHIHLNPRSDPAFWRYTFHDVGVKDLPAIIDKVLEVSNRNRIHLVGHMEATSASYVLLSEKPNYNKKIENLISLGPMAFMQNSQHEIVNQAINNNKAWLTKNLGISTFSPSEDVLSPVRTQCINQHFEERVCKNVFFLINGYNSKNFNQTTIREVLPRVPTQGSVRDFLHYAQMKKSGRFEKFNENFGTQQQSETVVEEYDLSKVTTPVAVIYTPNDKLSNVDDVKMLISKLPNLYAQQMIDEFSNNLDLLFANNVEKVNRMVLQYIRGNRV